MDTVTPPTVPTNSPTRTDSTPKTSNTPETLLQSTRSPQLSNRSDNSLVEVPVPQEHIDKELILWISAKSQAGSGSGSANLAPSLGLTPAPPPPMTPEAETTDFELRRILNQWKLTGELDINAVLARVPVSGRFVPKAASLMMLLDFINDLLCDYKAGTAPLDAGKLKSIADETLACFMRVAKKEKMPAELEAIRQKAVKRLLRILHCHPVFFDVFEVYHAGKTKFKPWVYACGLSSAIRTLEHLRNSAIEVSDVELDELTSFHTSARVVPDEVLKFIRSRQYSGPYRSHRPPTMGSLAEAGLSPPASLSSVSLTTSSFGNDSEYQTEKKRRHAEINAEESVSTAKRHRTESYGLPSSVPLLPLHPSIPSVSSIPSALAAPPLSSPPRLVERRKFTPPPASHDIDIHAVSLPDLRMRITHGSLPSNPLLPSTTAHPRPVYQVWQTPSGFTEINWTYHDQAPPSVHIQTMPPATSPAPMPRASTPTFGQTAIQAGAYVRDVEPTASDRLAPPSGNADIPGVAPSFPST